MLLAYPPHFWLKTIADKLVAAFDVHVGSSCVLLVIAFHVVEDNRLVCLLAKIYGLTWEYN